VNARYQIGPFRLDTNARVLTQGGAPTPLGPRAVAVLAALVERPHEFVAKESILAAAWPGLVVEESSLAAQISAIRRVLARAPGGERWVETLARRGYRFVGPVATLPDNPLQGAAERIRRTNLPQLLTSFVGHENDLAEYTHILEKTRLLTLTGIGGCGKTRLAIELARMILPSFPDGVWFVDLAPVAEAERVATAVATTLDVREDINQPIHETLARHLAGQHLLLVLDNCEHVLAACATLVESLLMAASGVRALITSREGLGIAGERIVPVRSLAFPPRGSARDPEAMATFEAVRLFVDRAQLVAPEFALNSTTIPFVAEICQRLDGIPLAIELAAARVQLLSVEQIQAHLDDRFRLLTASNKALPRHQTLRGVIEWSYEHLATNEQQVLRRLAVFAGGWTLAAATAVAGDSDDELAMVEMLGYLVDKSLVVVDREWSKEPRYRMLETVRQYTQERLDASGHGAAARARHLAYYCGLAEGAQPELMSDRGYSWMARLDADLTNLLAAHAWCESAPNGAEIALRLLTALTNYFHQRGLVGLARQALEEALKRDGATRECLASARALFAAGDLAARHHDFPIARRYLEDYLRIAPVVGDQAKTAMATALLGSIATAEGEHGRAQQLLETALALARENQDPSRKCSPSTASANSVGSWAMSNVHAERTNKRSRFATSTAWHEWAYYSISRSLPSGKDGTTLRETVSRRRRASYRASKISFMRHGFLT
jgi:predicted ATPase/DNA-binding winged helix-turn-helix (wHTH) protein